MTLDPRLITPHTSPDEPQIVYKNERGYLQLLADLLAYGGETPDRTGVGRRKLFERYLRFDLREGFPAFTARNTPPKFAFEEFWAFLNGITHIHPYLSEKGINFWKGNTTREFLDGRGLTSLPEGHLGKSYSFQIRHFGGDFDEQYNPVGGTDQLQYVYDELENAPFGSRIKLSMWNPEQLHEMTLPPCWWSHQFLVTVDSEGNKILNLSVNSRSADCLFGTPYNVQQYAFYLLAMAQAHDMIAGELACRLTDAHLYGQTSDLDKDPDDVDPASQMHYTKELLSREFSESPVTVVINKEINSLKDLLSLQYTDFVTQGYRPNKTLFKAKRPVMAT